MLPLVDCSMLRPPPPPICDEFTGLSPEVREYFFSEPENMARFDEAFFELKDAIRHWDFADGRTLIVPVACKAGMHRSVAMAEKLAKRISSWGAAPFELEIHVEHRTLWRFVVHQRDYCQENRVRYQNLRRRVLTDDRILVKEDNILRRTFVQGSAVSII